MSADYLAEAVDRVHVRRLPIHRVEVLGRDPADGVMVIVRLRVTGVQSRGIEVQHEPGMQGPLAGNARAHRDCDAELFLDFADEGQLLCLSWLDLATGELPPTGQVRRPRPSCREISTVALDGSRDDDGHVTELVTRHHRSRHVDTGHAPRLFGCRTFISTDEEIVGVVGRDRKDSDTGICQRGGER